MTLQQKIDRERRRIERLKADIRKLERTFLRAAKEERGAGPRTGAVWAFYRAMNLRIHVAATMKARALMRAQRRLTALLYERDLGRKL